MLIFIAVAFLAYSNGANDNFKGVASLYGSGAATFRKAINWATITTMAGSVCSIFLAQALLKKFSGKGLVPDALVGSETFLLPVALGAGLTVILATRFGFPISTTHGLTGAMIGAGLLAVGNQVDFSVLGKSFILPLLLSPVTAVALGALIYILFRLLKLKDGRILDAGHFLSAGVVSFARGLNDTPKMTGLLLVTSLNGTWGLILVAVAIAIGGLLNAKRVAETMSHKITKMNHEQGFTANLSTGILVILASVFGLPVSTTHVSVGSLFGIGLLTKQANINVVAGIALSWVLTLPCAALLSAVAYWVLMLKK